MMTLFDTTVALVDLDTPGHESSSKRRGLKRAMRQQTRLSRLGLGGLSEEQPPADPAAPPVSVIPNGDRFLMKTWPGTSLAGLQLPATVPPLVVDTDAAAAPLASARAADPAAAPKVQEMTGYKFLANREVVAQRDQALAAFEALFQADVARLIESCGVMFREEEKWTENWLKMVALLKE